MLEALAPYFAPGRGEETINYGVLGGITIGIIAALLWQRFYRTKLPPYLAFFGGRASCRSSPRSSRCSSPCCSR
ncbi:hypothetical protein [Georgenia sp. SUBG003]|uniref:hypothetical protein n=1 Tax=Georgenia sp. SUBG003 TaxID=1497974 RepID=UPI003AB6E197